MQKVFLLLMLCFMGVVRAQDTCMVRDNLLGEYDPPAGESRDGVVVHEPKAYSFVSAGGFTAVLKIKKQALQYEHFFQGIWDGGNYHFWVGTAGDEASFRLEGRDSNDVWCNTGAFGDLVLDQVHELIVYLMPASNSIRLVVDGNSFELACPSNFAWVDRDMLGVCLGGRYNSGTSPFTCDAMAYGSTLGAYWYDGLLRDDQAKQVLDNIAEDAADACGTCAQGQSALESIPTNHLVVSLDDHEFKTDSGGSSIVNFGEKTWNIFTNGGFTFVTKLKIDSSVEWGYEQPLIFVAHDDTSINPDGFRFQLQNTKTNPTLYHIFGQGGNFCGSYSIPVPTDQFVNLVWRYKLGDDRPTLEMNGVTKTGTNDGTCGPGFLTSDRTLTSNKMNVQESGAVENFAGEIAGFYGFDRWLDDAEAQTVLDSIVVDAEDTVHRCACNANYYPTPRVYPPPTTNSGFRKSGSSSKTYDVALTGSPYANGQYKIEYSSCYLNGNSYCPHHAFVHDNNSPWNDATWNGSPYTGPDNTYAGTGESLNGVNGQWIKIQLPEKIVFTGITTVATLYNANHNGRMPKTFKVFARNDDQGDWVEVYHQASTATPTFSAHAGIDNLAVAWQIEPSSATAYNTFALVVLSLINPGASTSLVVSDILLYGYALKHGCSACPYSLVSPEGATSAAACSGPCGENQYLRAESVSAGLQSQFFTQSALANQAGGADLTASATYNAYDFDTEGRFLDVSGDSRFDASVGDIYAAGQSDITVSFWVAGAQYDTNRHILRVHPTKLIIRTQILTSSTKRVLFYFFKDEANNVCESFVEMELETVDFQLVTVVKSGTSVTVYLNGVPVSASAYNAQLTSCSGGLASGTHATLLSLDNQGFFRGKLRDLRVYNRAIAPEEVTELYDLAAPVCQSCLAGMTSPAGSTSSDACVCAANSYKETDIQAQWPRVSFAAYENEFSSGGNMDNYAFLLWNGVSAKLISGWTHTGDYAHGFLRSGAGDSVLEVNGLVPGKEYLYATYNFHDPTHSYSWGLNSFVLYVNGVQVASLSGQPTSSEPTYAGKVAADSSGKILFKFTHATDHLHLSGLSVEAVCQSCPSSSTSPAGSTSSDSCVCQVNTYKQNITNTLTLHTDTGSHSWTEAQAYAASQGGRLPTLDELRAYETKTGYFAARNVNEWIPVTNPSAPSEADYMMAYNGYGYIFGDSRWQTTPSEGDPISSTFGQQDWTGVEQYPVWFSSDSACVQCPAGFSSAAGSISVDGCECFANFYQSKPVHTFVDGGSVSAEEFNGDRIVASEAVNLHDQPWTFIMKIKAGSSSAAASDYMKAFVVGRNCGTNDCIQVGWKSNTWEIYVSVAGSIKTGYPAAKTSTGNYDEIVVRVSATNGVRFRVNGVESTYSSSTSFSWINKAQLVTVGGRYESDSDNTVLSENYLRGHVAGFYAYQRELSDDELTSALSNIRENLNDDVVVSECSACPSGSISPAGSISRDSCKCQTGAYASAFKYESLTAWYRFETDARDYGPHNMHLQPRLGATPSFNAEGYITASNDISFLLPNPRKVIPTGTTAFTVSFWVKNWNFGYIMRFRPSNLHFYEYTDTSKQIELTIEGMTARHLLAKTTVWTLLVAVFTTESTLLYQDGVQVLSDTTNKLPSAGFEIEDGEYAAIFTDPGGTNTNSHQFQGDLKDLRFYNTAFTPYEVNELYTGQAGCVRCGNGLTTLAVGAESVDQCVCERGSFSQPAKISYNPSGGSQAFPGTALSKYPGQSSGNEVEGTDYIDLGPLDWNIASNGGFTAMGKFKTHSSSNYYMRVFELFDDFLSSQTLGIAVLQVGTGTGWRQSIYVNGQFSCVSETVTVSDNTVTTFIMRYDAASSTLYPTFNGVDLSNVTCSIPLDDYASLPWNMIAAPAWDNQYLHGEIFGVIAYDYFLTKEDAQEKLNGIKTDTVNVVNTECGVCSTATPYTNPDQGATSEGECQTTPDECTVVTTVISANGLSADVSSGLIAQYQFNDYGSEEGVLDSSGNGKTLTAYNAQYEDFAFKTTDQVDYFEVSNDGYFSPQKFTISFWIKLNTGVTVFGTVASCRESPGFRGWMIYHDSGNKLLFWTGTSSQWDAVTVDSAFDGTWQHFAITLDGASTTNNVEIFRDKVSLGKHSLGYARALVNNMRIGEGGNEASIISSWYPLASGSYLDEFRLYDHVLTLSEIEAVHDYRLPVLLADVTSRMVKYLRFPEGSSPYTLNFPTATSGEVLVVSATEFLHLPGVTFSAGEYTVTAGADTSVVTDAAGAVVATSAGGIGYLSPRWVLGAGGATCDDTCANVNMACDSATQTDVDTQNEVDNIATELGITCTNFYGRSYAGVPFVNERNQCYYVDLGDTWTGGPPKISASVCNDNAQTSSSELFPATAIHRPICHCVPATTGFEHAITGITETYNTPQVIIRYDTTVCPTTDPTDPPCPLDGTYIAPCGCPADYYQTASAGDETCTPCPDSMVSPAQSTSVDQCTQPSKKVTFSLSLTGAVSAAEFTPGLRGRIKAKIARNLRVSPKRVTIVSVQDARRRLLAVSLDVQVTAEDEAEAQTLTSETTSITSAVEEAASEENVTLTAELTSSAWTAVLATCCFKTWSA